MNKAAAKYSPERHRWVVDFSFRSKNDDQRRTVDRLGLLAHEVVRIWLHAVVPAAVVLEPEGVPVRRVVCPSREAARRLCRTFGGHIASARPKA
jgi:hypothetical protein